MMPAAESFPDSCALIGTVVYIALIRHQLAAARAAWISPIATATTRPGCRTGSGALSEADTRPQEDFARCLAQRRGHRTTSGVTGRSRHGTSSSLSPVTERFTPLLTGSSAGCSTRDADAFRTACPISAPSAVAREHDGFDQWPSRARGGRSSRLRAPASRARGIDVLAVRGERRVADDRLTGEVAQPRGFGRQPLAFVRQVGIKPTCRRRYDG